MKNIFKYAFLAIFTAFTFAACSPQEFDEYTLGDAYTISDSEVSFTAAQGANQWNYTFTAAINVDANQRPYSYEIRYGNGKGSKDLVSSTEYVVEPGTYTAELLVYVPNGTITRKTVDIVITETNPKFYQDDPSSIQYILTGGKENASGKEWTLSPRSAMTSPDGSQVWWEFGSQSEALSNDVFTFFPNSIQPNGKLVYDNNGDCFMNESLGGLFPDGDTEGSFVTTAYTPSTSASWSVDVTGGKTVMTLNNAFFGYAIAPSDLTKSQYEIIQFDDKTVKMVYLGSETRWEFIITCEPAVEPAEQIALTGGRDNPNGKAWKWRPDAKGSGVHMMNPAEDATWWKIEEGTTGAEAAYDDILTFWADGKAKMVNNGNNYMNESTASLFTDGDPKGGFITTEYKPAENASWSFTTVDGKQYLKLNKVFPMYGINPTLVTEGGLYEIVELTADLLHIKYNAVDVVWHLFLVPAN